MLASCQCTMQTSTQAKYTPLGVEPGRSLQNRSSRGNRSEIQIHWRTIVWSSLLGSIFSALIVSSIFSYHWGSSQARPPPARPCGRTPREAKAAGCIFDVMMDEWLPESCYDAELNEEFRGLKQWPFYTDANLTQKLTEDELSLQSEAYTTLEYHVAHCSFALRKLHRAIAQGRQIEVNVASEAHTTHCAEFLRTTILQLEQSNQSNGEKFSVMDFATPLHPGYPKCIDSKHVQLS